MKSSRALLIILYEITGTSSQSEGYSSKSLIGLLSCNFKLLSKCVPHMQSRGNVIYGCKWFWHLLMVIVECSSHRVQQLGILACDQWYYVNNGKNQQILCLTRAANTYFFVGPCLLTTLIMYCFDGASISYVIIGKGHPVILASITLDWYCDCHRVWPSSHATTQ